MGLICFYKKNHTPLPLSEHNVSLNFHMIIFSACSISQYFLGANLQEAGGQKAIVEEQAEEQAEDAAFIREELDHRET